MANWYPCEIEGVGVAMAIDQVRHWINESIHQTSVLPDSKPVVDCANILSQGKASKNPRLQSLMNCINRANVKLFHNSAKAGLHLVPDAGSRMRTSCSSTNCQVERFLDEIPSKIQLMASEVQDSTLLSIAFSSTEPAFIAATTSELSDKLTAGAGPIPLGSKSTWKELQSSDPNCHKFLQYKRDGELPKCVGGMGPYQSVFFLSLYNYPVLEENVDPQFLRLRHQMSVSLTLG